MRDNIPEFRERAAECYARAKATLSDSVKDRWLELAEEWEKLAVSKPVRYLTPFEDG